ncbi:MAG TPA: class I SAM-dependent methyltransferase [Thermoleophilaceae bacterium]|nr:class I SAM-dependent methyltransferase [Thermoleophilaceae bacterium]
MSSRASGADAPPGGAARWEEPAIWHDVECASYTADLDLWRGLAAAARGPVLELGAGTGRVALDLAARGHAVWAIDSDRALVSELSRRARERRLEVRARAGDARALSLNRRFALVVAPMQVAQLLGGSAGRRAMLAAVRAHLDPGATLAIALADPVEGLPAAEVLPPLPDVLEVGGWVYSSRPVAVRDAGAAIAIDRVREAVSPRGGLRESAATLVLDRVTPEELAAEAAQGGYRERERLRVPETEAYVGSDVLVLERIR